MGTNTAWRTFPVCRITLTVRSVYRSCRDQAVPGAMTSVARIGALVVAVVLALASDGPFDIPLFHTPKAPTARGQARLVFAPSPFGVAVTTDGRASYDVQVTASGLPEPSVLGTFSAYVAWAGSTDLSKCYHLGSVNNGSSPEGHAELNKFMLVITAEAGGAPTIKA